MKKYAIPILEIVLIVVLGSLMHFAYESTGKGFITGLFCPVNESLWEHWKIVIWPTIIVPIVIAKIQKKPLPGIYPLAASLVAFELVALGLSEVLKTFLPWQDGYYIFMYVVGAIVSVIVRRNLEGTKTTKDLERLALFIIIFQIFMTFMITINPPHKPYFKDSNTNTYGIYEEID